MKISHTALAISLTLLLGGCMVGPDYHRPQAPVPTQYKELSGWMQAAPSDEAPKGDWWTTFNDPLLDQLEPQVSVSNQTVRQAYANYQEALADVKVARASLFPTIGLSGSGTKQRTTSSSASLNPDFHPVSTSGSAEGNISWAPDLWGKVRRTIEENKATAQADQATLANATLSEQTALATAVIELRVTDANTDLLQKTVDAYTEYLRVVENQGTAGTTPPSDVITARTQLENAKASLIALGVARAQYEHAIAVLVGKNPEELDIPHSTTLPTLPDVPVGVPSTLLQRRPDITVAERQMAAQNAAVGVAISAYYPSISLSAADGFSQSPLAGLLHLANHIWSVGADVDETVFDFGARHGEVAAAKAAYEAAVANYRGTVLTAFQNVEDDFSGLRILAQQADVLDAAVKDSTQGAQIALNEYQAGTVDYTTAATAQATQLSTEESALSVKQQRLLDTVSLIGDLGGGWSADQLGDSKQADKQANAEH
ncbi:efflux transporter outer membrane subunit [Dyella caseinilytica]|uniref:Efflux transporter outer membrane subunit n=1 Tax=Dyella caseinilytica TaxID=1849581 RepID=A0ABX7GPG4_9GAMM|nr:efflux transporter outer membrane subunit [Dyella caseinilytica]QRN52301.1 efflux transporter outer membrane subunit [Dyella caseinilytica]GGA14686.1 RND transporter [Dyella caseinilytica]